MQGFSASFSQDVQEWFLVSIETVSIDFCASVSVAAGCGEFFPPCDVDILKFDGSPLVLLSHLCLLQFVYCYD
jgi:hypothetical protein